MREERIRSFIAFDLREPAILARIRKLQEELAQTGSDIRLVSPTNLHITLIFLGEQTRAVIDHIATVLEEVDFAPIELSLQGLGAFPNPRRINVVWVGINRGREDLEGIFQVLRSRLRGVETVKISKRFSPHITIARVRSRKNIKQLSERILSLRDVELGEGILDILKLKKSILTPKGPIYTTLAKKKATRLK